MVCPNCGEQLTAGTRFCPFCGASIQAKPQEHISPVPREEQDLPLQRLDNDLLERDGNSFPLGTASVEPNTKLRGMKWFKFIIYFQLFASGAMNVVNGIQLFTGAQYEGHAAAVYSTYPGMKTADYIYGVLCIAMAVLALYVRSRLAGFRRNGPALYFALLIMNVVAALGYLLLTSVALGISPGELLDSAAIGSVLGGAVLLIINLIYFGKRRDLFIN